MDSFFSRQSTALKICGVTLAQDAERLADLKVEALGINFWPHSKRYCSPEKAKTFSPMLKGKILRIGVFVNEVESNVLECFSQQLIDVAQFHGDESSDYLSHFARHNLPFIKAIGIKRTGEVPDFNSFFTPNLLLDAHAPGVYGGTGNTIDWEEAGKHVHAETQCSILLAGGITPKNAREAVSKVQPCAIDVASGAELSPGVKDFEKVQRLQEALILQKIKP